VKQGYDLFGFSSFHQRVAPFSGARLSFYLGIFSEAGQGLDYLFYGTDVLKSSSGYKIKVAESTQIIAAFGQGPLVLPLLATSINGPPYHGFNQIVEGHWHGALDYLIIGSGEQPIFAPWSGIAIPGPDGTWGNCNQVTIFNTRKDGLADIDMGVSLGHLTRVVVKPNQQVYKGDIIGYIDPNLYVSTTIRIACTTLPHLEIGVWGYVDKITYNDQGKLVSDGEHGWIDIEQLFSVKGNNNHPPLFINLDQFHEYKP